MEGYRSGHNEAVLKTVWGKPHMGSNPIPSAMKKALAVAGAFSLHINVDFMLRSYLIFAVIPEKILFLKPSVF